MQDLRSYVADHLKEEIAAEATIQNISSFAELILAHGKVGEIVYELLQPKEGRGSLWAAFLAENGEGLHHIRHNVTDVNAAAKALVEGGQKIVTYSGNPIAKPGVMAYV